MANLFKTRREREKDERRERRRAFRNAENRIDDVKDRIRQMQKDAETNWTQARDAIKSGQKAAAQRFLTSYRAAQVLMTKLEQKRWVFEQYLSKMQVAQTDQEFADALSAVNKVTAINPERVTDVFEASQDILGEQMDADRFWSKLYSKEMDGAAGSLEDHIPSISDMEKQIEDEASAELGGASAERVGNDLDERIRTGQERVKSLLEGK